MEKQVTLESALRRLKFELTTVEGRNSELTLRVSIWWRHQMETFSALLAFCAGNSPVPGEFPHKGQRRGALMFSLICVWINGWVNNRKAGDLRRYRIHYDVIVMIWWHGNAFPIADPLLGESTGHRRFPLSRACNADFLFGVFLVVSLNKLLEKKHTSYGWVETPWRSYDVT